VWNEVVSVRLSFPERRPAVIGIVSILIIVAGTTLAFSVNRFEGLRGVYSVSADLTDAAGLQSGNEVRIAGVKVGRITRVELTDEAARVTMEIAGDVRVPVETTLEVKLKTLLGQKFIDLRFPKSYVQAASLGSPEDATAGYLVAGDVIPLDRTSVPFEVHQAAREGTDVLEGIDKKALRRMLGVFAGSIEVSKEEIGDALAALDDAGKVLGTKSAGISRLLGNLDRLSGALASSDQDIEGVLSGGADVLGVLAERRETTSSLLAAADDLGETLGLLLRVARGSIQVGAHDLNSILLSAEAELASIDAAISELGVAQEMFARPLQFGRFTEGAVCAVTSADTCVPDGTPYEPGFPVLGRQPGGPYS
jgi:phospholipid/cholesterol/gamma-HCH transport system substrate-binding protein